MGIQVYREKNKASEDHKINNRAHFVTQIWCASICEHLPPYILGHYEKVDSGLSYKTSSATNFVVLQILPLKRRRKGKREQLTMNEKESGTCQGPPFFCLQLQKMLRCLHKRTEIS